MQRDRSAHVSDQIEVSYFASENPEQAGTNDLVRRTSEYPDSEPGKGGRVEVVATDIDLFTLEYLDPTTSLWTETWDTTQATGQVNRLPLEVRIRLVLRQGTRTASDRGRGRWKSRLRKRVTIQPRVQTLFQRNPGGLSRTAPRRTQSKRQNRKSHHPRVHRDDHESGCQTA